MLIGLSRGGWSSSTPRIEAVELPWLSGLVGEDFIDEG